MARKLAAEAVGTYAWAVARSSSTPGTRQLGHVSVSIAFGLAIMFGVYAVGHISGAHFNPAVTFGFALSRRFPWRDAGLYWSAQLAGALLAAWAIRASLGNHAGLGTTLPAGSQGQAFVWELILTFFLVFVIMAVATDTRAVGEAAAIAIGGTVGLDALVGGPISGASMNPARSIGPSVVSGDVHALWLYVVAPLVGATVGALGYQFVRGQAAG